MSSIYEDDQTPLFLSWVTTRIKGFREKIIITIQNKPDSFSIKRYILDLQFTNNFHKIFFFLVVQNYRFTHFAKIAGNLDEYLVYDCLRILQVAAHDAPVKTCHWVKTPNYTCLMTASWDKTLKFWDTRSSVPMMTMNLSERCYCADVVSQITFIKRLGKLSLSRLCPNQRRMYF